MRYVIGLARTTLFPTTYDIYRRDDGDNRYRFNYPDLNNTSVVFDVGGYVGDFAQTIYDKYQPQILVFEPVKDFFEQIGERFKGIDHISCYQFGLTGEATHSDEILLSQDASSTETSCVGTKESVLMVNINDFLKQHSIEQVDLLKLNIEGGEFSLLEALIASDNIKKFRNIQVQFHSFIPNAEDKMKHIQALLHKTHDLTWQYVFVFENWRLRE